jgi:hypothetical protein
MAGESGQERRARALDGHPGVGGPTDPSDRDGVPNLAAEDPATASETGAKPGSNSDQADSQAADSRENGTDLS